MEDLLAEGTQYGEVEGRFSSLEEVTRLDDLTWETQFRGVASHN